MLFVTTPNLITQFTGNINNFNVSKCDQNHKDKWDNRKADNPDNRRE